MSCRYQYTLQAIVLLASCSQLSCDTLDHKAARHGVQGGIGRHRLISVDQRPLLRLACRIRLAQRWIVESLLRQVRRVIAGSHLAVQERADHRFSARSFADLGPSWHSDRRRVCLAWTLGPAQLAAGVGPEKEGVRTMQLFLGQRGHFEVGQRRIGPESDVRKELTWDAAGSAVQWVVPGCRRRRRRFLLTLRGCWLCRGFRSTRALSHATARWWCLAYARWCAERTGVSRSRLRRRPTHGRHPRHDERRLAVTCGAKT